MSVTTKAKSCTGKHQHGSRAAALAHLWSIVRERGASARAYDAYRCRHCDRWHVGHRKGRR